jgi:hypothetical protein
MKSSRLRCLKMLLMIANTTWTSWNEPDWGSTFSRADSLGLARAVQIKIAGNGTNPWAMNSISYKYNPRKIKV